MAARTAAPANEVHLVGRVSGEPAARTLPSGDELVQFRLVVPREGRREDGGRTRVDTIDIACWAAGVRRTAGRLPDGQAVEVLGQLRRRFFAAGGGRASRYEVEATQVRRVELE
ncbi:single-strand DNA-binding protein [Ornithinimicrobium humiphilum]|uniref:Single-strand DNA-binding protein n=1 Tax=Ornithinimicrobium humiphilum TaxID=125288 RepID=A0A543KP39_9MICO|nr:single-stranded DNA-binding protein [Ornithinimicrobium humiphilum]TQM96837.1 single-strand DNA-binding protein [Ornithinimicrobium humiphilum]